MGETEDVCGQCPSTFSEADMSRESNGNAKSAAAELKPLQLLDLPVDVLTEIVKRVTPLPLLPDSD